MQHTHSRDVCLCVCVFWGSDLELNVLFIWRFVGWLYGFALLKTCPFTEGIRSDKCVCWSGHMNTAHRSSEACLVRIGWYCSCRSLIGYSNCLSLVVFVAVMRRNPFAAEGCCRKGSRNALQELYNPTQVSVRWILCHTYQSIGLHCENILGKNNRVKCGENVIKTRWQWVFINTTTLK